MNTSRADETYSRGVEAYESGDLDGAIKHLEECLALPEIGPKLRPRASKVLYLALMHRHLVSELPERPAAVSLLERIAKLRDDLEPPEMRWDASVNLAQWYLDLFHWLQVVDDLIAAQANARIAVDESPIIYDHRRLALQLLAEAETGLDMFSRIPAERVQLARDALRHWQEAYELFPAGGESLARARSQYNVAHAHRILGLRAQDPDETRAALDLLRQVEEVPDLPEDFSRDVHNLEGLCLKDLGELDLEIVAYVTALGGIDDPESAVKMDLKVARNLANALAKRSQLTEAPGDAAKALSLYESLGKVADSAEQTELTASNWLSFALATSRWDEAIRAGEWGLDQMREHVHKQVAFRGTSLVGAPLTDIGRMLAQAYVEIGDPLAAAATVVRFRSVILRHVLGPGAESRSITELTEAKEHVLATARSRPVCYLLDLPDELVAVTIHPDAAILVSRIPVASVALSHCAGDYWMGLAMLESLRAWPLLEQALERTGRWLGDVLRDVMLALDRDTPIAIVATGRWNLLPIQVAYLPEGHGSGEWLMDRLQLTFLDSGRLARVSPQAKDGGLVLVAHSGTRKDLTAVAVETEAVAAAWSGSTRTNLPLRSRDDVMSALRSAEAVHVACHASFDVVSPSASALHLEDGSLSIADLLESHVRMEASMVFLSACSTGAAMPLLPDEAISLAGVFAALGATDVVSTRWPVPDVAAALTAIHFFELLWEDNTNPPEALRLAQRRVRDSTGPVGQLSAEFIPRLPGPAPPGIASWAAFSHTAG